MGLTRTSGTSGTSSSIIPCGTIIGILVIICISLLGPTILFFQQQISNGLPMFKSGGCLTDPQNCKSSNCNSLYNWLIALLGPIGVGILLILFVLSRIKITPLKRRTINLTDSSSTVTFTSFINHYFYILLPFLEYWDIKEKDGWEKLKNAFKNLNLIKPSPSNRNTDNKTPVARISNMFEHFFSNYINRPSSSSKILKSKLPVDGP